MTLPASGDISLSQVNAEIGANSTATISMGDSAVRTLFQTLSGDITMNAGHGQNPRIQWVGLTQAYPPVISSVGTDQLIQFYGNSANGSVTPANTVTVRILVVGGGSGGDFRYGVGGGGGGGGGVYDNSSVVLQAGVTYGITIGKGGSGSGPDLAAGSGGTTVFSGGSINISIPGGLPSGYSSGRNAGQGQGGGANGGTLPDGPAPYPPPQSNITGGGVYYGGGGGAGGNTGGTANGWGGGNGGSSFQQGSPAVNFGAGGGGGGYYTGGTYYYGGDGKSGVVYIRGAFNTGAPVTPLPTYGFLSLPASINEGTTSTIQVVTTYVNTGTTLYWTIGTNASQFGTSSGSFSISNSLGQFSVSPTADLTTEGSMRFNIYLRTGSVSGTIVAASANLVINDTSTTPVTATFGSYANLVNEGASVTFPVSATGLVTGDSLYWTVDYNASSSLADFTAASGSFTVAGTSAASTGSFTVTAIADLLTEGNETFYVNVRSGSVTGTILRTAGPITISDTSISPTFAFSFGGGTNLNLRTLAVAAGWKSSQVLTATNTGTIDAYNRSLPALTIDGSFPAGVTFINNSTIAGGGGTGGTGASYYGSAYHDGTDGGAGSTAINIGTNVTIVNNGTIGGGGGGGGGSGGWTAGNLAPGFGNLPYNELYDGGGGGGGAGYGAAGVSPTSPTIPAPFVNWPGEPAAYGSLTTGGYGGFMGGAAADGAPAFPAIGGDGGSLGQAGGDAGGDNPLQTYALITYMKNGKGGQPGAAIAKNGYVVTVTNNATILGTVG
jgi:hypothetical protein